VILPPRGPPNLVRLIVSQITFYIVSFNQGCSSGSN